MSQLFLVHCGYYDAGVADGAYEIHTNYFVAAETFEDAALKAKALPEYEKKKMHIDGMIKVEKVGGYVVTLVESDGGAKESLLHGKPNRFTKTIKGKNLRNGQLSK